jgi:hypothetical protein
MDVITSKKLFTRHNAKTFSTRLPTPSKVNNYINFDIVSQRQLYNIKMPRKGKKPKPEEPLDLEDEELPTVDPYAELGVEKSATADDIKTAYRKAALKHHPGKPSYSTVLMESSRLSVCWILNSSSFRCYRLRLMRTTADDSSQTRRLQTRKMKPTPNFRRLPSHMLFSLTPSAENATIPPAQLPSPWPMTTLPTSTGQSSIPPNLRM